MRSVAELASVQFTLLSRSSSTSRTLEGEYLFSAEFLFHHKLPSAKGLSHSNQLRVYALLVTDMGRFCRKALMSVLFICKPPL